MIDAANLYPCKACNQTGLSSSGKTCKPCHGTGLCGWISPTQIKLARECEVKWVIRHVLGVVHPPNASAALGSRVHKILEDYYRDGGYLSQISKEHAIAGRIAAATDALPLSGVLVEQTQLAFSGGFAYLAIGDLVDPHTHKVYDHKTSSDPKKYGLTKETLPYDEQAAINALAYQQTNEYTGPVQLQWTYASTRNASPAYPVPASIDSNDLASLMPPINATAARIVQLRNGGTPITQPDSCDSYGGCPNQHVCPGYRKRIPMAVDNAMLEKIRAMTNAKKAAAEAEAPAEAEAEAPAVAAGPVDKLAAMKAKIAAAQAAAEAEAAAMLAAAEAEAEAEAAAVAAASAPAKVKATTKPAAAAKAPAPGSHAIGVLYIDCVPTGDVDVQDLHAIVNEANDLVCAAKGVTHYKACEYGSGPGELHNAIAAVLDDKFYAHAKACYVTRDALPALIAAAKIVVYPVG